MVRFRTSKPELRSTKPCRAPGNSVAPSPKTEMLLFLKLLILSTIWPCIIAQSSSDLSTNDMNGQDWDHAGYGWPTRVVAGVKELGDCEGLGFRNATKNSCGICTGGSTMLPDSYLKDCSGQCLGEGMDVDCNKDCGGTAYIDECSGECIGGRSRKQPKDVLSYRDCRGSCTSSGLQLYTDSCGVCHTKVSPFQDCTNRCHLPGEEKSMAKQLCGRCIGGSTGIPESEVLDPCGNCKDDGINCPCNGTGFPDVCGVCNGGGNSCFRVVKFHPRAILGRLQTRFAVEGAFFGRTKNVKCIFIEILKDGSSGNQTEFATVSNNGTYIHCAVKLKLGTYRVGVKIPSSEPAVDFIEETELLVHERPSYSSMSPNQAVLKRDGSRNMFVTFSGGRVPRLPLICVYYEEGFPNNKHIAPSEPNTLDTCVIPSPDVSKTFVIHPSFNGFQYFKSSFKLKFFASPPDMKKYYIAEDGHAVVIVFDNPVNICNLSDCSRILNNETLSRLGVGAQCKWATKWQLIIIAQKPIKGNPFRVTFLKSVLKHDGQKYSLQKNDSLSIETWYPQPANSAQIAISGPATVSNCGSFSLTGHFSSPKGDAEFYWTAYRDDQRLLETPIASALSRIHSATLLLNAQLLEVNMGYTFVLTAEHPINDKHEARHKVTALSYIGPLVTAYSDGMTQPSISIDQRITLYTDVTIPSCSTTTEYLHIMWTVSNPEVKFNFKSRSSRVYIIEPYSLPENSIVTFYANAYFGNMINITKSQVQLRVEPLKLKAVIKGTSKRIVGNERGTLVLESENVNKKVHVVYQWRCSDQDGPICYNYKENSTEPLLIPKDIQNSPALKISCDSLKAGKVLTFELQVFNAKNRYQFSSTASVIVVVVDKEIPQVIIESVLADGSLPVERHPTTGAYDIPSGLSVTVLAQLTSIIQIKSANWNIKGFSSSYTQTAKKGTSVLSLDEGFLVGHGIYIIELVACDVKGGCGNATLTIHAVPGISLCKLTQIPPYVEFEQIRIEVKGCSIPIGRQPVTYQLNLHSQETVISITAPQTSNIFNILGPPQQSENGTQISVQACDKYMLCTLFYGPIIKVISSENRELARASVLKEAVLATENRNLMPALSSFLTVSSDPSTELTQLEVTQLLTVASKATQNRYISTGQLSLIYSSMFTLLRRDENRIKLKALDIIKRATRLAYAHNDKIPSTVLSQGHSYVAEALHSRTSNHEVFNKVKDVLDYFVYRISASVPLGRKVELSSEHPGYPTTLVSRQLLLGSPLVVKARTSEGAQLEGSVKFEDSVQEKIKSKECEVDCEGIVVALTLYPAHSPYPSNKKRTSPVLDVTLRNPENGSPILITDAPNGIRVSLTHIANNSEAHTKEGLLNRCSYWDVEQNDWSEEGMVTYGTEGKQMRCWSSHLTSFAVVESYTGLGTGAIVGIVVTCLMGVFIFMGFGFIFVRKKQAASTRVSHENLPKRDKLNDSMVKVKSMKP